MPMHFILHIKTVILNYTQSLNMVLYRGWDDLRRPEYDPVRLPPPQVLRIHDLTNDRSRMVQPTQLDISLVDQFTPRSDARRKDPVTIRGGSGRTGFIVDRKSGGGDQPGSRRSVVAGTVFVVVRSTVAVDHQRRPGPVHRRRFAVGGVRRRAITVVDGRGGDDDRTRTGDAETDQLALERWSTFVQRRHVVLKTLNNRILSIGARSPTKRTVDENQRSFDHDDFYSARFFTPVVRKRSLNGFASIVAFIESRIAASPSGSNITAI